MIITDTMQSFLMDIARERFELTMEAIRYSQVRHKLRLYWQHPRRPGPGRRPKQIASRCPYRPNRR